MDEGKSQGCNWPGNADLPEVIGAVLSVAVVAHRRLDVTAFASVRHFGDNFSGRMRLKPT